MFAFDSKTQFLTENLPKSQEKNVKVYRALTFTKQNEPNLYDSIR